MVENIHCPICNRETLPVYQEKHHLIPRKTRKSIKEDKTIIICCSCGDMLHQLFSNKELGKKYNTLEAILGDQNIQKWIEWIQKKPNDFSVCMATKKKR